MDTSFSRPDYSENRSGTELLQRVFSNHLIFNPIFGSLSVEDLKNCRLVSSYWKEISEPFFLSKSIVKFLPAHQYSPPLRDNTSGTTRQLKPVHHKKALSKFLKEWDPQSPIQEVSFTLNNEFLEAEEEDILNFFQLFGHGLKIIHLSISDISSTHVAIYLRIIAKLPGVREIKFSMYNIPQSFLPLDMAPLPSVKKLTIDGDYREGWTDSTPNQVHQIAVDCIRVFPAIESLKLRETDHHDPHTILLRSAFNQEVNRTQVHIKKYSFTVCRDEECGQLVELRNNLTVTNLHIRPDWNGTRPTGPAFISYNRLLEKHAPTLLKLNIEYVYLHSRRPESQPLVIPVMPKLKTLKFEFSFQHSGIEGLIFQPQFTFSFNQDGTSGTRLDYSKQFPQLEKLEFGCNYLNRNRFPDIQGIWDLMFPRPYPPVRCPTLRYLGMEGIYKVTEPREFSRCLRVASYAFPNVCHLNPHYPLFYHFIQMRNTNRVKLPENLI